ncbi:MAG: DUF4908 domain-containing protein [Phenylobacterium sp.]|uniref:DUF4908 domain-containing protein n=1 Tax=Phenylobacterium sp. TaxID=1871053 RepID=UPI00391BFEAA
MATLVAMTCALAGGAQAQTLREGLFGPRPSDGRRMSPPPVARYVSEDGEHFVLDRSTARPLLKFDDSPEVYALQAQPAPRGDVIYKNDLGEPVLRATRLGGLTLFTDDRPGGTAAALDGDTQPLRLPVIGPQALLERLAQASARASRAARRLIPFEADATPTSAPLLADAAMVTAEAVVHMSRRPDGRAVLSRITKVELVEGKKPSADIARGVMRVTVVPAQGLAGRPSSKRIISAAQIR